MLFGHQRHLTAAYQIKARQEVLHRYTSAGISPRPPVYCISLDHPKASDKLGNNSRLHYRLLALRQRRRLELKVVTTPVLALIKNSAIRSEKFEALTKFQLAFHLRSVSNRGRPEC